MKGKLDEAFEKRKKKEMEEKPEEWNPECTKKGETEGCTNKCWLYKKDQLYPNNERPCERREHIPERVRQIAARMCTQRCSTMGCGGNCWRHEGDCVCAQRISQQRWLETFAERATAPEVERLQGPRALMVTTKDGEEIRDRRQKER